MAWKYVIVRAGNQEIPLIFPDRLVHQAMSELLREYLVQVAAEVMPPATLNKLREEIQPVAAGNITFDVGECYGESETLRLQARSNDTRFIKGYNYHHGQVE